jgi:hypothetical protein
MELGYKQIKTREMQDEAAGLVPAMCLAGFAIGALATLFHLVVMGGF